MGELAEKFGTTGETLINDNSTAIKDSDGNIVFIKSGVEMDLGSDSNSATLTLNDFKTGETFTLNDHSFYSESSNEFSENNWLAKCCA